MEFRITWSRTIDNDPHPYRSRFMKNDKLIESVTQADFDREVLVASRTRPVLVDFWAAWCSPCRMLAPLLEQLAAEYAGKLTIVKVDSDREPQLAARFEVRNLPTVKLFAEGKLVSGFTGLIPLSGIRAFLERHLPRASDALRQQARRELSAGRFVEAVALLRSAYETDPQNHRVHPELAAALLAQGEYDDAEAVIKSLPPNLQHSEECTILLARLGFARIAGKAPRVELLEAAVATNPDDLDARYQMSAIMAAQGEYETAMENLLEIIRRDRNYRDDAGRRALIDVFAILKNEGPLVRKYRALLSSALH